MAKLTQAEWEADGTRLFGEDKERWRFRCPRCSHTASIADARATMLALKGSGWNPSAECVGRYLPDRGCDWAAYGLLRGPVIVTMPDGHEVPAFAFGEP